VLDIPPGPQGLQEARLHPHAPVSYVQDERPVATFARDGERARDEGLLPVVRRG
jgi:hypothetical protein